MGNVPVWWRDVKQEDAGREVCSAASKGIVTTSSKVLGVAVFEVTEVLCRVVVANIHVHGDNENGHARMFENRPESDVLAGVTLGWQRRRIASLGGS